MQNNSNNKMKVIEKTKYKKQVNKKTSNKTQDKLMPI